MQPGDTERKVKRPLISVLSTHQGWARLDTDQGPIPIRGTSGQVNIWTFFIDGSDSAQMWQGGIWRLRSNQCRILTPRTPSVLVQHELSYMILGRSEQEIRAPWHFLFQCFPLTCGTTSATHLIIIIKMLYHSSWSYSCSSFPEFPLAPEHQ